MRLVRRSKRYALGIGTGTGAIDTYAVAPVPLVSDGFYFVFLAADGKGHTAGAASYVDTTAGMGGDGAVWTVSAGSTWGTTNNRLGCSVLGASTAYAYFDAGEADVHIEATCIRSGGAVGILLRWVDSSNYAYVTMTNTSLRVHQVIAGTPSTLYDAAFTYSSNALLEVDVTGTGVTATYNGAEITTQTLNAALTNGTKHGVWTNNTGNSIGRIACYDGATYPAGQAVNLSRAAITISGTSDRTSALVPGATVTQHSFVNATDTDLSRTSSDPLWGTLGPVAIHLRHFGFSDNMSAQASGATEGDRVTNTIAGENITFTEHDAMLTLLEANGVTEVVLKIWGFPEWMLDAATGAESVLQTFETTYRAEAAAYVQAFIKRYNTDATVAGISIIAADWGHEQKGGYSSDMARFVADYNAIYAAIKAQDSSVLTGGPYIVIFGNGTVNFGQADATETREAIESSKRTDFETFTAGATAFDFLSFDAKTWVDAAPTLTYDEALEMFGYWGRYIEKLRQLTGYTAEPLWGAEVYGFNINDYADFTEAEQAALHAAMLWYMTHHGVANWFQWIIEKPSGQEKYGYWNSTDDNPTSAVTTTPAYDVHLAFKNNFGAGVDLYPVTVTGDAAGLLAMASLTKLLLINLRPSSRSVVYDGITYTLGAYETQIVSLYELDDSFATAHAQGAVQGASADPGPGTIELVSDTNSDIVISGGKLRLPTGASAAWYASKVRAPGLILRWTADSMTNNNVGWDENQAGNATSGNSVQVTSGGDIRAYNNSQFAVVGTYAAETDWLIALRTDGSFLFVLRSGNWVLLWSASGETASTMYPTFATTASGNLAVSLARVPQRHWLPTPLVSDGFSDTVSDGLGHAEGVAGGVGAGGDGVTWTGATWTVSGGVAYNTPTLGAELLTDPGVEDWASATDLTSWSEVLSGTSSVNQESSDIHGGTYAARLDVDASNNSVAIRQLDTFTAGAWHVFSFWAKANVGGKTITIRNVDDVSVANFATLTTSYAQYISTARGIGATSIGPLVSRSSAASASLYFDDLSIKALTLAELFLSFDAGTPEVICAVNVTLTAGTQAGLVLNLDDAGTPANFVIAYHDGATVKMDKCVAGTYTNLISATTTYVAGARLTVQRSGNAVRVYYNDLLVGTEQTISDAGIVSNTLHGLFSTDDATFDNLVAYATGTGGEYSILDEI